MSILDTTKDLAALFVQQAKATPDAIALEDETRSYTYAELEKETAVFASRLRQYGVCRDASVGVLMGRSADYVITCLAALRAGGAFLVLELAYPPRLLGEVIEDARPAVIVTKTAHVGQIKADIPKIVLDATDQTNGHVPTNGHLEETVDETDLEKLCFVSYSSGTTGKPKGIANPHRAPVLSYDKRFGLSDLGPGDRVACNVFFVWEILRPLIRGGTVVSVPDETSYDPVGLVKLLAARNITETLMTPTLLATVLTRHSDLHTKLASLKTLWLNGEVVTVDLARRALKALPHTRLLNCYSASETHEIACGDIGTMIHENEKVCPVGPPVDPEHTYILDENRMPVPLGVSGELFIGGQLLARGYLNLPETTAKAFVPDPFAKEAGALMYRSGDQARMLPSGNLEITGRVGAMIKIRGYTIQPGAVESVIVEHLAVRHCAVVSSGEGLQRQLVAYVVPERDGESNGRVKLVIDGSGFSPVARKALTEHLAHYMIPALWVEMEQLPTHEVSGKVDHKSLPPVKTTNAPASKPQENDTKIKLQDIAEHWAASLNMSSSAAIKDHDFFDLGGHSLALADLASRYAKGFGFPVPLGPLAGNPTLKGHQEIITAARDGHTAAVQADLPAVLRADSVLAEEIKPAGASQTIPLSKASTVFLTGTTGFLGAFLLRTILETTSAKVICLVRFPDPSKGGDLRPAGMARLRKHLLDLGLWQDSMLDRIEIFPGNLARNRLGLSPEGFQELASRVQVIIHAGATVNLVYPYAALRAANVAGTREILRLGCMAGAAVHHVSTNGVFPSNPEHQNKGWAEDEVVDISDVPDKLADGYCQTKWVAEQLVLEAGRRGLPVRIYRPGTISGDSESGCTNAWDLLTALIVESIHIGHSPIVDGWVAEMTPVDFVSRAIAALCDHTCAADKHRIFHLGDPAPITAQHLFKEIGELGYATKPLPYHEWIDLWTEQRGGVRSLPGDGSFTVDILRGSNLPSLDLRNSAVVLDDACTRGVLREHGLERPVVNRQLLETYSRHFYSRGWLSKAPLRSPSVLASRFTGITSANRPFIGRVAVITGASSGIGAAVALALARRGANIALGARRLDALEAIKKQAEACGVKVVAQKTDVTDSAQVTALFHAAEAELGGPVDTLVSCAGVMYYTMMANVQAEEWDRTVDVNCKGLLHCLAACVPGMLSRGRGHIVAISSDAGRKVFPGLGVYSASKFFVEATLQSLRLETAGQGLRVTAVQPGNTDTGLLGMSTDAEALKKYGEPTGAKVLVAEDVAGAVVYALQQPENVAVNEVLIEPRDEPI